ncbi:hypothetical protein [Paraburkholderia hospita]|uniref:hypothetical protein n=1 Tax=Paraburkholderia hospita TaxID=169430 RepID=UPI0013F157A8|nr:hypothetical protein [Paraburkholderia hospita]
MEKGVHDTGNAVQKGAQDTGNAVQKGAQDTGNAVQKGAQDAGNAVQKGAQDAGNAVQKGVQDSGKALEKAGQDTGKTVEIAAHDTGKALEKAGQDIGHVLKELVNFSLSCSLPSSKPDSLKKPYQQTCGSAFSTYQNDVDVCTHAGGASLIAAAAAGAAPLTAAETAGGTYVLAKAAFELCQKACRSQDAVTGCVSAVDKSAFQAASEAATVTAANQREEERLALFTCIDSAYSAEKTLRMDSILAECEADKTCNTNSPAFNAKFLERVNKENAETDVLRKQVQSQLKAGSKGNTDYGPSILLDALSKISLTSDTDKSTMLCYAKTPNVVFHATVKPSAPKDMTLRWIRDGRIMSQPSVTANAGNINVPVSLAKLGAGKWKVQLLALNGVELGSFGFVYRPEPPLK